MRATQFWILLMCSSIVSFMMIKQIFLSRAIIRQQHVLVDAHETTESAPAFEGAWKQMALRIYQASLQDPTMTELLKSEGITVHNGPAPDSATAPANMAPVPATSSKPTQATPPVATHPAGP